MARNLSGFSCARDGETERFQTREVIIETWQFKGQGPGLVNVL